MLLGSGKFVTPCLRMQAENFGPSLVPTFIPIWNWPPCEPPGVPSLPGGAWELLSVVLAGVVPAAFVPRFATCGEPPPPPHPAATSAKPTTATTEARMYGRRRMSFSSFSYGRGRLR